MSDARNHNRDMVEIWSSPVNLQQICRVEWSGAGEAPRFQDLAAIVEPSLPSSLIYLQLSLLRRYLDLIIRVTFVVKKSSKV